MLDLTKHRDCAWNPDLIPKGYDTWDKETFEEWWGRNEVAVFGLPAMLCEQWIYKYWCRAQFSFLPLETLTCEDIEMTASEILEQVHREFGVTPTPDHDRNLFENRKLFGGLHPTAQAFADLNTWDYPIVLLKTPHGIKSYNVEQPHTRLVLVEGHQRHRYLYALNHFDDAPPGPHKVYVLSSPITEE